MNAGIDFARFTLEDERAPRAVDWHRWTLTWQSACRRSSGTDLPSCPRGGHLLLGAASANRNGEVDGGSHHWIYIFRVPPFHIPKCAGKLKSTVRTHTCWEAMLCFSQQSGHVRIGDPLLGALILGQDCVSGYIISLLVESNLGQTFRVHACEQHCCLCT